MTVIREVAFESALAASLYALQAAEWPELQPFKQEEFGRLVPCPLVALKSDRLIGGASFVSYYEPGSESVGTWLNALIVIPQERRQGVATALIEASAKAAGRVYALTDVPELYTKRGWRSISSDKEGTVVKYEP